MADHLATFPTVQAVALGGSRAQGTHRPESDWDLAICYRGDFDPADLRAVGRPGEVSEIGGWGGGVFNGGAWLTIDDRRVDVHYRDLDIVQHERAEAESNRKPSSRSSEPARTSAATAVAESRTARIAARRREVNGCMPFGLLQ